MESYMFMIRRFGIRLYIEKEKLKYEAPPGEMNKNRKEYIQNHKEEVIEYIKQNTLKIFSEIIGEVYLIRKPSLSHLTPPGSTVYTLEELGELLNKKPSPSQLKIINECKKHFNGEVINEKTG